jgi:hypothetical protein
MISWRMNRQTDIESPNDKRLPSLKPIVLQKRLLMPLLSN